MENKRIQFVIVGTIKWFAVEHAPSVTTDELREWYRLPGHLKKHGETVPLGHDEWRCSTIADGEIIVIEPKTLEQNRTIIVAHSKSKCKGGDYYEGRDGKPSRDWRLA